MSIPARYSGVCVECGERWQPGDLIRADKYHDRGKALWTHDVCPDPIIDALMAPARTGEISCPTCFLIHPKGACDR